MTKNQLLELFPIGPEIPSRFRLYDPVSAITGGVGLVGNVVGGFMGNSAAKKAGAIQQQAANNAADSVIKTAQDVNPQITTAAQNAGAGVSTSSGLAADAVQNAAKDAGTGVTTAAGDANSRLDSYSGAGSTAADQLKAGLAEGGDFNRNFTAADFQSDPGYQFRLQQGIAAMQRSGAAAGGALGGSAAKDLMSFNSGLAAQDYQNAFQRFQDQIDQPRQLPVERQLLGHRVGHLGQDAQPAQLIQHRLRRRLFRRARGDGRQRLRGQLRGHEPSGAGAFRARTGGLTGIPLVSPGADRSLSRVCAKYKKQVILSQ